jgi:DNA-binding response OmpR family regulator
MFQPASNNHAGEYVIPGRILVATADEHVADVRANAFRAAGYDVLATLDAGAALEAAGRFDPDVVVLDAGLPNRSGFDACAALSQSSQAFIVMVGAGVHDSDVTLGLELGADDYLIEPFADGELLARVSSFFRRRLKIAGRRSDARMSIGNTRLDQDSHALVHEGRRVTLTALEFRLMYCLGGAEGRLLARAHILASVWNDTSGVPTRVVDVHVAALRKKLSEVGAPLRISSVRGVGYRLDRRD